MDNLKFVFRESDNVNEFAKTFARYFLINRPKTGYRKLLEKKEHVSKSNSEKENQVRPEVVYVTGLPRTGSSLLKNYIGGEEETRAIPFQDFGYQNAWEISKNEKRIVIDKATHYIWSIDEIYESYGDSVAFMVIIRDPRDQLLSLMDTFLHLEIPRGKRFGEFWRSAIENVIEFSERKEPQKLFILRYEDLVKKPSKVLSSFGEWVNIDVENEGRKYDIVNKNDSQDHKLYYKNEIHKSSMEKYLSMEDEYRSRAVKMLMGEEDVVNMMRELGYEEEGVGDISLRLEGSGIIFGRK